LAAVVQFKLLVAILNFHQLLQMAAASVLKVIYPQTMAALAVQVVHQLTVVLVVLQVRQDKVMQALHQARPKVHQAAAAVQAQLVQMSLIVMVEQAAQEHLIHILVVQ
jgi:hypothetical protein